MSVSNTAKNREGENNTHKTMEFLTWLDSYYLSKSDSADQGILVYIGGDVGEATFAATTE